MIEVGAYVEEIVYDSRDNSIVRMVLGLAGKQWTVEGGKVYEI